MSDGFNARKAAQLAAFFCNREGAPIPVLKLVKLVYLADRQFLETYGFPITNDTHVSMPHGPVNSATLNHIGGIVDAPEWNDLIAGRAGHNVAIARQLTDVDTDELSEAEIEVMDAVWEKFGHMTKFEIVQWTHDNCPEWEDPKGSSYVIPLERTLRYLGFDNADQFAKRSEVYRDFQRVLGDLREQNADSPW